MVYHLGRWKVSYRPRGQYPVLRLGGPDVQVFVRPSDVSNSFLAQTAMHSPDESWSATITTSGNKNRVSGSDMVFDNQATVGLWSLGTS